MRWRAQGILYNLLIIYYIEINMLGNKLGISANLTEVTRPACRGNSRETQRKFLLERIIDWPNPRSAAKVIGHVPRKWIGI